MEPSLRGATFALLLLLVLVLFLGELSLGTVRIPPGEVGRILLRNPGTDTAWEPILWQLRLPRAIAALVCGAALGTAGLLLQTLFRNPLAGPWALGITAGAQLGVALVVVTGSVVGSEFLRRLGFLSNLGLVFGSFLGSAVILALVASVARQVSTITLLVLGLMLGFLAEGMVSVVLHFTNEAQGRVFAAWNDGSYASVTWEHFPSLLPLVGLGIISAFFLIKPLNALLLGERYAESLGLSVERTRLAALGTSLLLAAPVTAYCGPVVFVGLIVPHLARGILRTSDHRILVPAVVLCGAALGLGADLFVHLPWERHFLHLNAVNGLVGAPVVIWVILRSREVRSMVA